MGFLLRATDCNFFENSMDCTELKKADKRVCALQEVIAKGSLKTKTYQCMTMIEDELMFGVPSTMGAKLGQWAWLFRFEMPKALHIKLEEEMAPNAGDSLVEILLLCRA